MKTKKILILAFASLLLASSALFSKNTKVTSQNKEVNRGHCCHKKCSIVGTWTLNIEGFGGTPIWGLAQFQEDGSCIVMDSGDIGQPVPSAFPNGFAATVQMGSWKRISKKTFQIFFTAVFAPKDPENCCLSIPFARSKLVGTVTLNEDCQDMNITFDVSFWALDDLTLNTTPVAPATTLHAVGHKVGNL